MPYFITFEDHVEYALNVAEFTKQLKTRWSSVEFEDIDPEEGFYVLRWWLHEDNVDHVGGLHSDHQTIDLDDFPEGIAPFVVWFRSIVPSQYRLMLAHDSSSDEIELTENLTADEIEKL